MPDSNLILPKFSLDHLDIDVPGMIIIFLNRQESVVEINHSGCEILGRSREEILGQNWFSSFLPEKTREERRTNFRNMLRGKSHLQFYSGPIATAAGEKFIAWHGMMIHDNNGKAVGVLFSGRDITAERRADNEMEKYLQRLETGLADRTSDFARKNSDLKHADVEKKKLAAGLNLKSIMLDKAPEPILLTNREGELIFLNEEGRTLLEFEPQEGAGEEAEKGEAAAARAFFAAVSAKLKGKKDLKFALPFTRRDGAEVRLQVHACVLDTPDGERILSILHNQ